MISPTDIPEDEFSVELIIYIYIFLFDVEAWLLSALNPGYGGTRHGQINVLCFWLKHFSLAVRPFIQEYEWMRLTVKES